MVLNLQLYTVLQNKDIYRQYFIPLYLNSKKINWFKENAPLIDEFTVRRPNITYQWINLN